MTEKFSEILKGYISVKANGGFSEKFLNLCSEEKIEIRDIKYVGKDIFFFTRPTYYRRLKKIAALSGMNIKVYGRFGLPFFVKKHRERLALVICLAFGICFISFMSTRIWTVTVTGNSKVYDTEIISEFEKLGLYTGVRKRDVDVISIQDKFLSEFSDKIIWVSVNIEGMSAEIEIRETQKAKAHSDGKPCNIVAAFDGTIMLMRTYSGTAVESVKNGVRRGDLLISGIVEYYDGALNFVEARGEIAAKHTVKVQTKMENTEKRAYTSQKNRYSMSAFACTLFEKESKTENSEVTTAEFSAYLNSVKLPFSYMRMVETNYVSSDSESDYSLLYLLTKYMSEVEEKTKNSDVISVKTKIGGDKGNAKITGEIECVDFVGKSVPINIKNE